MRRKTTKVNTKPIDAALKTLGAKSPADTVATVHKEIMALRRFKDLMTKNAGKLKFSGDGRP